MNALVVIDDRDGFRPTMSHRICPDCRARYLPVRGTCLCRRDLFAEIVAAVTREMAAVTSDQRGER